MSTIIRGQALVGDQDTILAGMQSMWPTAQVVKRGDRCVIATGTKERWWVEAARDENTQRWSTRWDSDAVPNIHREAGLDQNADLSSAIQQHALASHVRAELGSEWNVDLDTNEVDELGRKKIVLEVSQIGWD